ncbi:hypothetical protein [Paenibacillus piri]|uniref:Uncharacterized protein n=1 Tax=Paenibacillus piri TaxID=2547395 RepID=A0A4R5KEE4_9BACL|nr:hypothetical protein [Paenibacillus piri]TDF93749.1 hypothetical protein E1757_25460 [Paenibacillus piri]
MTQQQNGVKTIAGGTLIRKVLLTNAASSGAVGLLLLLFPGFAGSWTGLDNLTALAGTGVFLLIVVAFLWWTATRNVVSPRQVLVFAILDFLWVIDSALLLGVSGSVTTIGIWAIIVVAAVVGVFAIFEMSYYWHNRYYRK